MSSASISRRRNLQNGTILIANQAAQLVNFPLAQEVARHVHKLVVAIKPDILQAPKDNDMSACELANRIGKLIDFLDEAADETGSDVNIPDSAVEYLLELEQLRSDLRCSLTELQSICGLGYPTKFASQSRIQGSIQNKKEQLMQAKVDVLTSLTMFTLTTGLQNTQTLSQTRQDLRQLADSHKTLCQRLERLEHRGTMGLPMWRIDWLRQGPTACAVLVDQRLVFFFRDANCQVTAALVAE